MSKIKMDAKKGYLADGRISWSQLETFEKSRTKYVEKYVHGINDPFVTNAMTLGTQIHDAIANRTSEDMAIQMLIDLVPKGSNPNMHVEMDFNGAKLHGYLDDMDADSVIDYKVSGVDKWDADKVDNHGQLAFYALLTGKTKTKIVHIHTAYNEQNRLYITGDYDVIERNITETDIKHIKARINKMITWCDDLTPQMVELKVPKGIKSRLIQYALLEKRIASLGNKRDALAQIIQDTMEKTGALQYKTEIGTAYWRTNKKFDYPENIKQKESDIKTATEKLKKEKSDFEVDAVPVTETRSITIRLNK